MESVKNIIRNSAILGLLFGLALASKYSAALFLPVIISGYLIGFLYHRRVREISVSVAVFFLSLTLSFRLFQPFFFSGLLSPNPKIITNLSNLKSLEVASVWFPPSVQWATAPKIVFPALNLFWWGIGPIASLIAVFSLLLFLRHPRNLLLAPAMLWIFWLFLYNGLAFSMTARYFYPLLPLLSVFSGLGLTYFFHRLRPTVFGLILATCLISPVAFLSIYTRPHTRVQASDWITRYLPVGSMLSCDEWDDCLPLGDSSAYRVVSFPVFWRDSQTNLERNHWQSLFNQVDYLVISSNRAYASSTSVPDLSPVTARFYSELFSNRTEFRLLAKFNSRPSIPLPGLKVCITPPSFDYGHVASGLASCSEPGLSLIDDYAEEAYTVYDHPQVFIFQRHR